MFQFIGCFLSTSKVEWQDVTLAGLPHSEIHESRLTCSSSWLIAAYRVLLRFETPRHPPYALLHLTYCSPSHISGTAYPVICFVSLIDIAYYVSVGFRASNGIFSADPTWNRNFILWCKVFSLYPNLLGKIFLVRKTSWHEYTKSPLF